MSWVGRRMRRREDGELLTGRSRFVADLSRPGMAHAAFLRCPFPNARINSIDVEAARAMAGVHAVLTGEDLPADLGAQPNTHLFGERETPYYALARGRARYAGEPVAVVVADSPYIAEDARDEIVVDWDPLASVGDVGRALDGGAPIVDELTIWTSSQIAHITRDLLAQVLGLPEHRIRVLVPRIGGGFGAKFHFYPEETAIALAARATGRPVRWVEDRLAAFLATVHAREQRIEISMAARRDGTITGVKGDVVGDMGAAMHTVGYGPLWLTSVMLTNVYEIPNARVRARAVVTNKTPLGSFRGWGQPQANFVVERTVDRLARELGRDRAELRRQNFIPPERLPRKSLHHTLDSGDYPGCLDRALALLSERGWPGRQRELRDEGRHVGIGISFYTENSALGPSRMLNQGGVQQGGYDMARVRVEPGGEVTLYTGLCEMGQGLMNALTQVCADNVGVHPDRIMVVTGDSSQVPYTGYGTGASRGAAVGGAAVMKASRTVRAKAPRIAGHMLEANPDDL